MNLSAACGLTKKEPRQPPVLLLGIFAQSSLDPANYTEYSTQYPHSLEPFISVSHASLALLSDGPKFGLRPQNEFEAQAHGRFPQRRDREPGVCQVLDRQLVRDDIAPRYIYFARDTSAVSFIA